MINDVARLHVSALPHTISSKLGVGFVACLYCLVNCFGYVEVVKRRGKIVGVMSRVGKWILTLAIAPDCQRQGIGREMIEGQNGKRYVYTEECSSGFYEKLGFKRIKKIGKIIFLCRS